MKGLLIEEMKRAIELLEKKDEIKVMKVEKIKGYNDREFELASVDRETSEIKQMLKAIRKHSVIFEKEIK